VGARDDVVHTEFGIVHRVRARTGLERIPAVKVRQHQLIWRVPLLARAVERLVLARPGTLLIHSFASFGCVGAAAHEALRRQGLATVSVVSAYDTLVREGRAKLRGAKAHGAVARISFAVELLWNKLLVARYERRGLRGARLVLVNYESVRRILVESYGISERVRTIPYSSEAAFLDGRGRPPLPSGLAGLASPAPLVVAVSRQDPRKGLDILLHALARLRRAGLPFRACLVGGGPLLTAHRRLAGRLGLDGLVAIEGFVPDPYSYLQHADVFVLPSLEEGSGSLSLLEALQAGLAVVASNVDGIPEDLEDGTSALLVPPGDSLELARALERVLTDPELRRRLGRQGRAIFETRFSADRFSAAIQTVYAELGVTP
jgi:glycosyltransferase involved in cell wall biosynthesis